MKSLTRASLVMVGWPRHSFNHRIFLVFGLLGLKQLVQVIIIIFQIANKFKIAWCFDLAARLQAHTPFKAVSTCRQITVLDKYIHG